MFLKLVRVWWKKHVTCKGELKFSCKNFIRKVKLIYLNICWRILLRHSLQKWNAKILTMFIVWLFLHFFLVLSEWTCNMEHKIQAVDISKSVTFELFLFKKMSLYQTLQLLTKFVARHLLQSHVHHHVASCNHYVLRIILFCRVTGS